MRRSVSGEKCSSWSVFGSRRAVTTSALDQFPTNAVFGCRERKGAVVLTIIEAFCLKFSEDAVDTLKSSNLDLKTVYLTTLFVFHFMNLRVSSRA